MYSAARKVTWINTSKPLRLAAGTQKTLDMRLLSLLSEGNSSLLKALQTLTWEPGIPFSQENPIPLEPSTEVMFKTEQLLEFPPLLY